MNAVHYKILQLITLFHFEQQSRILFQDDRMQDVISTRNFLRNTKVQALPMKGDCFRVPVRGDNSFTLSKCRQVINFEIFILLISSCNLESLRGKSSKIKLKIPENN